MLQKRNEKLNKQDHKDIICFTFNNPTLYNVSFYNQS